MLEKLFLFLQREKNHLSRLNWRKKAGYFWDYYRYWALLAVGLIFLGIFSLQGMHYRNQPVVISGMFLNVGTEPEGYDCLSDGYLQWLEVSGSRADVIEMLTVEYTQGEQTGIGTGSISSVDSLIAAQALDYVILDESALRYFGPLELCADVDALLSERQNNHLEENLVVCYGLDRKRDYYAAIEISDSPFAQKFGLTQKPAYLVILVNSPRSQSELSDFLDYFFEIS